MDSPPPDLNTKVLEYQGKFYVPSNKRIAYMKDKTLDDRYFILTLLGTAMELENRIQKGFYHLIPDRPVSIELLLGLPPADYTGLYEKFEQYFLRSREPIAFRYGNREYSIQYHEVVSYIQAYAAAMMYSKEYNLLALHKVLIIDIGGFTLDYMMLRYGEPDTNGFDTLERGVIPMYNSIVHRVRNQSNHLLEEVDVDMIIMGENTVFSEDVCALALSVTEEYVVLTLPGQKKCAYFCITSDQDSTFDVLATLFVSFLCIKLVRYADKQPDRKLPVPVFFILDEFPNIGVIPDFKKKLATARSRQLGMCILYQNIPQLQNRYPDGQWEEILGGCDTSLFLGCNDLTTATYFSDRSGTVTVGVASIRKNLHTFQMTDYVPDYSESSSVGKRMLLLPDEVLRFPLNEALLIIRGQKVLRVKKFDYMRHPEAEKLKPEKTDVHIPEWRREEECKDIGDWKKTDIMDETSVMELIKIKKTLSANAVVHTLKSKNEIQNMNKEVNLVDEVNERKKIEKVEDLFC